MRAILACAYQSGLIKVMTGPGVRAVMVRRHACHYRPQTRNKTREVNVNDLNIDDFDCSGFLGIRKDQIKDLKTKVTQDLQPKIRLIAQEKTSPCVNSCSACKGRSPATIKVFDSGPLTILMRASAQKPALAMVQPPVAFGFKCARDPDDSAELPWPAAVMPT